MNRTRPPVVAEALLRLILATPDREFILGDLAEQYRERVLAGRGRVAARLWYWRQVAESVGPVVRRHRETKRYNTLQQANRSPAGGGMDAIRQDLTFAVRQLRHNKGFALAVVLTLALGIGSNTAIFTVINGTLLQPLPYPESEDVVYVTTRLDKAGVLATHLAPADFADLRDQVTSMKVAAISETVVLPLSTEGRSETVSIQRVTWNMFDLLGVQPVLGRAYKAADGVPVTQDSWRPRPVILSYGLWQSWFGGDPGVVGQSVRMNGSPAEVVGVMPAEFGVYLPPVANIGSDIDVWWPNRFDYSAGSRESYGSRVVGRLVEGATMAEAQQEVNVFAMRLRDQFEYDQQVGKQFDVLSLHEGVVGPVRGTLVMFLGAVGFVMLIACANVANLLMARGTGRATELAVRAALGADRRRIVRQVLTESAVLSILGAVAGVALAAVGVQVLLAFRPPDLPRIADFSIDPAVLVFAAGVAVFATLLYGLIPALQYSRVRLAGALGQRGGTSGTKQRRVQAALATGEVALSIVLLAGAALMVRSFREMQQVPLGFETEGLLTFRTNTITACDWVDNGFQCDRQQIEDDIERRLAGIPGVQRAGMVFPLPLNGIYDRIADYTPDQLREDDNAKRQVYFRTASPSYFATMGIRLVSGRNFTRAENDTLVAIVVVDEALAESEWPGENPIGKKLALFGWGFDRPDAYEVIGVAERVPQWDHRDPRPTVYLPRRFYQSIEVSAAIRVAGDPASLVPIIRQELEAVSPDLPLEIVRMKELISGSLAPTRFVLTLLSVFSIMALALAAIGLYGVLAFTVRQRTREIGIRMAFGAMTANVVREVMKRGMRIVLIGTALGIAGATLLGGALERHLFGVAPSDPLSLAGTALVVMGIGALASYVPARRAARVDPIVALRIE